MTFDPAIPRPNDLLSDSQGDLLNNNIALDASFENDHTKFSDTTPKNGQHKQVTLYQSITPPVPTLTAPASMLYSLTTGTVPTTSITDLFFSCIDTTVQKNYQMTNLPITTVVGGNTGSAGGSMNYIDTPWNFRIYFGTTNAFSSSNKTVIFPTPYNQIIMANGFSNTAAGDVVTTGLESATKLSLGTNAMVSVNWFAMGRL